MPNPLSPVGTIQQGTLRDAEMGQTVRDTKVETKYDPVTGGEELYTKKTTIYMMDGSRHERTAHTKSDFSDRSPSVVERHIDKNGKLVSETSSVTYTEFARNDMANAKVTTVRMADGTLTTFIERPDGRRSATVTTPDGRQADVPVNLLNHPALTATDARSPDWTRRPARAYRC